MRATATTDPGSTPTPRRRSAVRRWVLALSIAAGVMAMPAEASEVTAAGCEPDEILVNPCRPWVGAASNTYVNGFRNSILDHEARAGRQMDIVHNYHGPGEVLTDDDVALATRPGTIGFFNYRPSSNWSSAGGGNALVDSRIDDMAASIAALGDTKIFLTIAHEPENNVSSGGDPDCPTTLYRGNSGTTAQYRQMWQNVRNRFDALGVDNVVWVMNYLGYDRWDCLIPGLWPGNDLVDWVMWDPYPGNNFTFEQKVGRFYDVLTAANDAEHAFLSKPWGLAEYGYVGSSQTRAYQFYADILQTAKDGVFPQLRAYSVWDSRARNDNRVQYSRAGVFDQAEQDAYNALVNDPFFSDTPPLPDNEPPSVSITDPTDGDTVTGTTTVAGPATDNIGVTTCELLVDGTTIDTTAPGTDTCSIVWNSATTTDGPHTLALAATDAATNRTTSTPIDITVDNTVANTPPAVPTGVTAVVGTTGSGAPLVSLSWQADLDDATWFRITRNGSVLTTTGPVLTWDDAGVSSGQTYVYSIEAFDAAGNSSGPSDTATATTPSPAGPDTTSPSRPQNLTADAGNDQVTLEWEPSTDNVGVASYYLFRANRKYVQLPGSQTSFVDTDVTAGQRYVYKVYAIDTSGNWSGSSNKPAARPF